MSDAGLTRFVLLAEPRTGSNLLSGMLSSRDDVLSVGEIFNPSEDIRGRNSIRTIELRENPAAYLDRCLYGTASHRAAGFRFFYKHAESWPDVCLYLRDISAHVIHLLRENPIDRYISEEVARMTGAWVSLTDTATPQAAATRISIVPDKLIRSMHSSAHLQDYYRDWFCENPSLSVTFESLVSDIPAESRRVQEFLGLAPATLEPTTRRQLSAAKESLVANYGEIVDAIEFAVAAGNAPAAWLRHLARST